MTTSSTQQDLAEIRERLVKLQEQNRFLREQIDEMHFRRQGLEDDLADWRKRNKALERRLARYTQEGVKDDAILRVFKHWVAAAGKHQTRTILTADRRKIITAAIKQRDEATCLKIVSQGCKTPYLVYGNWKASGSPDSLKNDITDFLGKGKHTEQLLAIAEAKPVPVVTEDQMAQWVDRLLSSEAVLKRLYEVKMWSADRLEELGVGYDGLRVVFPVRDRDGGLTGIVRYLPGERRNDQPKSIAVGGRGLFPHPESIPGDTIWLVEGEPDAVSAHEMWLPAVAIPGVGISAGDWIERFKGRKVVICFDCDKPGRLAAKLLAKPLAQHAAEVRVVDLSQSREDGYDLTDWLNQGLKKKTLEAKAKEAKPVDPVSRPTLTPSTPTNAWMPDAFDAFVGALEKHDRDPRELRGGQWQALCPAHDDRVPTLHFKRGDSTPVVADCKAGCSWDDISAALNHPTRKD